PKDGTNNPCVHHREGIESLNNWHATRLYDTSIMVPRAPYASVKMKRKFYGLVEPESWSSSSSSTTVEELAREIRLEVDEYKRRGYLTLSAHLDEYRNRREREAKMIIERERLTAELLMFSGDTLTRQFTENM
ncbi:hypothetical protein FOZ62_012628, partial [Perkinsus olseni]